MRDVSRMLYFDTKKKAVDKKANLTREEADVDSRWGDAVERPAQSRYLIYLTVGTFLFFVTAIATHILFGMPVLIGRFLRKRLPLSRRVRLRADGGAAVPLTIRVANRNSVPITAASLYVTYPKGTYKREGDVVVPLENKDKELFLDEIERGGIVKSAYYAGVFSGRVAPRKKFHIY